LVVAAFLEGTPDPAADVGERFLPLDPFPLPFAPRPGALQGIEDPIRVVDLVDRGRPLRAVAAAASGMRRVPFELAYRERLAIDPCQEATGGLAVEAHGRHEHRVPCDFPRPGFRIPLDAVVPGLRRRIGLELVQMRETSINCSEPAAEPSRRPIRTERDQSMRA